MVKWFPGGLGMMSFDGGVLGPASMTKPCSESVEMPPEVLRAPHS